MSGITVKVVDSGRTDEMAPPPGTAIVRPARHVRAVRERYLQRFTDLAEVAASRSARAWGWALGETPIAPVTDQATTVPPERSAIEVEITVADERRLRGERENRADAAAAVLRWLIGIDDHVPARCDNPGELVGGFGDIIRTRQQLADLVALAGPAQRDAAAKSLEADATADDRERARREADYLHGVLMTLAWARGDRDETLISWTRLGVTAKALKRVRTHAEDAIEQGAGWYAADRFSSRAYAEGVKSAITWLLGDSTAPPIPWSVIRPPDDS